jgi:hypothetical protein
MAGIKPNDFPSLSGGLTGNEELYTQTGGVNNKFTVQDIWNGNNYVLNSTGTPISNYYIEISGTPTQVWGAKVDFTNLNDGETIVHNLNVNIYLDVRVIVTSPFASISVIPLQGGSVYILTGNDPNEFDEIGTGSAIPLNGFAIIYYIPN